MLNVEWIREERNRTPVLLASVALILAIAATEWWTNRHFSLGLLYLFPIMLSAGFLPRRAIVLQGAGCASLSEHLSNLDPSHAYIRLGVEALALCGCGLLVAETLRHARSKPEIQKRMHVLFEMGPVAIIKVDERGAFELANPAAVELLAPRAQHVIERPMAGFLPALHHALRWEAGPQFRTSIECRGHRDNGQPFLARAWFSGSRDGRGPKLAAIIADIGAG
jgi:PAS domain-containing protein